MKNIHEFSRHLRAAGLTVAPSEISEAQRTVELLGTQSPETEHYVALQTCLIKRFEDQAVFASVYSIYFGHSPHLKQIDGPNQSKCSQGSGWSSLGLSTIALALLNGDYSPCTQQLRSASEMLCSSNVSIQENIRRVLVNLDYFAELNTLRLSKESGIIEEWLYQSALSNASEFNRLVQVEVLRTLINQGVTQVEAAADLNWRTKPFNKLGTCESALINSYLSKIGRKLAVRPGTITRNAFNGCLDLPATLRKSMAQGGGIYNLKYSRKVPSKPELVLLCDVSNSVYQFTGFMLQLIIAFRQKFTRVNVYLFVDILWKVPDDFFRTNTTKALENIRENNLCSMSGLSNFGKVFSQFETEVLHELSAQTTLMILGDAKNNWNPTEVASFKNIAGWVKKVFWLNPLPKMEWGQDDCQLKAYGPYCKGVFECGNLSQLSDVVSKIS